MTQPIHKHFIVRAEVKLPPRKEDQQYIRDWMSYLIEDIGMKLLYGPITKYVSVKGNEGMTAFAMIETSHIAMHVWEKEDPPLMQLDVYTCGLLNAEIILKALKDFEPIKIQWKYLDREFGLKTIDIGIWEEGDTWPNKYILRGDE